MFSVWAKAGSGSAPLFIKLLWYNASGSVIGGTHAFPAVDDVSTGWTQVVAEVIAPAGAVSVRVGIEAHSGAGGQVHYFDDLSVTTTDETVTVTTVASKGFESTTDGLSVVSGATVSSSTAQARTGTKSLAIVPTAGWSVADASPGTAINASSRYQVTGWKRLSTGSGHLSVGVQWFNSAGTMVRQDDTNSTSAVT